MVVLTCYHLVWMTQYIRIHRKKRKNFIMFETLQTKIISLTHHHMVFRLEAGRWQSSPLQSWSSGSCTCSDSKSCQSISFWSRQLCFLLLLFHALFLLRPLLVNYFLLTYTLNNLSPVSVYFAAVFFLHLRISGALHFTYFSLVLPHFPFCFRCTFYRIRLSSFFFLNVDVTTTYNETLHS